MELVFTCFLTVILGSFVNPLRVFRALDHNQPKLTLGHFNQESWNSFLSTRYSSKYFVTGLIFKCLRYSEAAHLNTFYFSLYHLETSDRFILYFAAIMSYLIPTS